MTKGVYLIEEFCDGFYYFYFTDEDIFSATFPDYELKEKNN